MNSKAQKENARHYDEAYSSRFLLRAIAKLFVSYDQLSKTRRNLSIIRQAVGGRRQCTVLDYGFGNGSLLLRLPRRFELLGCELSHAGRRNLERIAKLLGRKITLSAPRRFPETVRDGEIDLIVCSHVLEHVDDEAALLDLFHRKLNDRGQLLVNVPVNEVWRDPRHVRDYTAESLEAALGRAGFVVANPLLADRWTAFILRKEYVDAIRFRWATRLLRLILALLPQRLADYSERILPADCQPQQLITLASKREPVPRAKK